MKHYFKILTALLFLAIFFIVFSELKTVNALVQEATNLQVSSQSCNSQGKVITTFSWTRGQEEGWLAIDAQWLDVKLNDSNFIDSPKNYIGSSNPPFKDSSSFTTGQTGAQVGPLEPGKTHYWRINTHYLNENWHPKVAAPFTTITCNSGGETNIVVDDLRASFTDVGPGVFTWTPYLIIPTTSGVPGVLAIGTNSTNPLSGAVATYPVNTDDGSAGVPQPATGTYYAAMYTGAYGEVRMSNITTFTIGSAGGIKLDPPTITGNTVIFTFTPSDGSFVVIADRDSCPSMLTLPRDFDSGQIAPGITQVNFTGAAPGTYCAKIVKALSGATLSNSVSFSVEEPPIDVGPPPAPFGIGDPGIFSPSSRFQTFGRLASDIVLILTSIAGALLLFFIVLAGFKFATSSGDPKKIASASSTLTYALIGIAIVILAFVIVRILQFFLQSNVPVV